MGKPEQVDLMEPRQVQKYCNLKYDLFIIYLCIDSKWENVARRLWPVIKFLSVTSKRINSFLKFYVCEPSELSCLL